MTRSVYVQLASLLVVAGVAGSASAQQATPPTLTKDTIVLLPDTQYYSDFDADTFHKQTQWIAHPDRRAFVKMVAHLGDITNDNGFLFQWPVAVSAMNVLREAGVPFVMVPGNHDNPEDGEFRDTTFYNHFFPPAGFASHLDDWESLDGTSDNSVVRFTAGGRDLMIVNLEFAPRKQTLCRANDEITANPNRSVIVVTHCYQSATGCWEDCTAKYGLIGSNGRTIWDELVSRHNNVQMVLSGHITSSAHTQRSLATGAQVVTGDVHEILTDLQFVRLPSTLPGVPGPKHGLGWMRSLGIDSSNDDITIDTFSVYDPTVATTQLAAYIAGDPQGDFPNWQDHWNETFTMPRTFPPHFPSELWNVHDFTINENSNGDQLRPRIAGNHLGASTVVWSDDSVAPHGIFQVKARGFRPDGCERTAQDTVNQVAQGQQINAAAAMAPDGSTVVVWQDDKDENGFYQILAAGYDGAGHRKFGDIPINQVSDGQQRFPDVAVDSNGNFVVVWQDDLNQGVHDIKGARFDALGQRLDPDFTVNAGATNGHQLAPRIAMRQAIGSPQDGAFVVTWQDDFNDNNVYQIKAARYSPAGARLTWPGQGGAFIRTINQFEAGQQQLPAVAMHINGDFVIVWQDDRNDNDVFQIKMAGFDAGGNKKVWGPNGEEDKTVNQFPSGQQLHPQISMNDLGHFVVVWEDDRNENDIFQIKAAGFNLTGARITPEDQTVNSNPEGQQVWPDVLLNNADQVFVVWQDDVNNNNVQEIVGRTYLLGGPVELPPPAAEQPLPLFAQMEGPPWVATQGAIDVDTAHQTEGSSSIAFLPGFAEARPPGFDTAVFPAIGSKLLVDVFIPEAQPASNYKGAVQLYWGMPGAGYNHQFVGQKELSPLAGGTWHVLEFDLPDVMRRLFLESRKNAELAFAVNTQGDAPARTLLDNLRFGGVLIPHAKTECDSGACLSICGPGKLSCDGNAANGCETYVGHSRSHCGACGNSCGAGLCVYGTCEPAGARNIAVNLSVTSQWDTGYCAALTFTNQALVPVVWEAVVDLRGSTITSSWNGTFTGTQGLIGVTGVTANREIQPGASLSSLGFCAQRPLGGNTAVVRQTNTQFQ